MARLGGDEFAVIQSGANTAEEASRLADRLIAAISTPRQVMGHSLIVRASIGIALAPRDGTNARELLHNADVALYAAKRAGRGNSRLFDRVTTARVPLVEDFAELTGG